MESKAKNNTVSFIRLKKYVSHKEYACSLDIWIEIISIGLVFSSSSDGIVLMHVVAKVIYVI